MDEQPRVRSLEEAEQHIGSLTTRVGELERAVRDLQRLEDTMATGLRKRLIFAIDGWPWWRVVARPQRRPWRRWWRS